MGDDLRVWAIGVVDDDKYTVAKDTPSIYYR
jgi:hypothetical protein